jgi:prepilin-type N-terminal cleavage/methylation domain-containing protein
MYRLGRLCIHDQRGVTLLELLLSLTVLSMLLPVLAGLLVSITQTWNGEVDRLEAREQAEAILRRVESDVRESRSISVQTNGVSFTDPLGHVIHYWLSQGGLMLRDDNGLGAGVVGARVLSCRFTTEVNGSLLRMQLTVGTGNAKTDLDQVWFGRGNPP